jgi:hypothetical protein
MLKNAADYELFAQRAEERSGEVARELAVMG